MNLTISKVNFSELHVKLLKIVFELIRNINDPEHPLTLEQLNVVSLDNIHCDDKESIIKIFFTPTIPHCNMATMIGLMIRVKLLRSLPDRFKVNFLIFMSY